jgi:hypothetical protein
MTIIALTAATLLGVTAAAGGLHYGPAAGINYANFRWNPSPYVYPEQRMGLAAGGYLAWDLDPAVQLRAELWYSEKGAYAEYSELLADSLSGLDMRRDHQTQARLSYLEMPLFLSFVLSRRENQLGALSLGPYLGWLLDGELRTSVFSSTTAFSYSREYRLDRSRFRRADVGLAAGLTAYVYRFDVNVRYHLGLRPALTEEFDDINRFMYPVNRSWSFSLGYQIR